MFNLPNYATVKLSNVNPRIEKHGTESVPAVDLNFSFQTSNTVLEQFQPGLLEALYKADDEEGGDDSQPELDGVEAVSHLPLLRFPKMDSIRWTHKMIGGFLSIDYGVGVDSAIELECVDVGKWTLDCLEGGTVDVKFQVQANKGLTERILGKLSLMIGQEVDIRLMPAQPVAEQKPMDLVLPGQQDESKPLTAEDVFIAGSAPGATAAAAVH